MPAPVPLPVRRTLVRLARQGRSAVETARRLDLSERTVRHLVQRVRERGEDGVHPSYSTKPVNAFAERAALDASRAWAEVGPAARFGAGPGQGSA